MRIFIVLSLITLVLFACKNRSDEKVVKKEKPVPGIDTALIEHTRDSILLNLRTEILTAFKNKNYDSLASLIHPDEGVLFSPYGYVDTANNVIVKAATLKTWADRTKQEKVVWGWFDASEEEIKMNMDDYVKRFVYDVDFLKPDSIKVDELVAGEHVLNMLKGFFPDSRFVESYFKGFDPKYEGMDWKGLRLVFKLKDGKYYLVAVIHDEWVI